MNHLSVFSPSAYTAQLFFNPASGSFAPGKADAIIAMLKDAGINCQVHYPSSALEAGELVRCITQRTEEPLVIAVGGDGTVNSILNGISNPRTLLGYIPLGTANVLARELGIKTCSEAIARIKNGMPRFFTAGKLVMRTESRLFLCMAGIGFDGAVVATVRQREKKAIGKGAYLLSAIRQLRAWDQSHIALDADGESMSCHTAIICNAAFYGGNFRIAPETSIFSPSFTLLGAATCGRIEFFFWAMRSIFNSQLLSGQGLSRQVSRVDIYGTKAVQLDGDAAGQTPASITAIPSFARILV